jgi:hypothetical protein
LTWNILSGIADSSRFQGKFISASELAKCAMWVVEPWGGSSRAEP